MYEKEIEQLQKMIDQSSRIVFFGGCGCLDGKRDTGFSKCRRNLQSEGEVFTGADRKPYVFYAAIRKIFMSFIKRK